MQGAKNIAVSTILTVLSLVISFGAAEIILRVKNSSMTNYDVEMWRYAKELKVRSPDPALDFDHVPSTTAILQNVEIRINEWGLRGGPVTPMPPGGRRILFLGGSITLGWGVAEEDTVEARLEKKLRAAGVEAQVLNGGIGNYNADRYVSRFFRELTALQPTDIVVHYFLRDAEELPPGNSNFLLRHSELAVTLWIAFHRLFDDSGESSLVAHYRRVYEPANPGFLKMKDDLVKLAAYAKAQGIHIYLAMIPDVHNLVDYKLGTIHETMKQIATEDGYTDIDLLHALAGRPPEQLWAMPGDPHPNALGHKLMAEAIFQVLANGGDAAANNK